MNLRPTLTLAPTFGLVIGFSLAFSLAPASSSFAQADVVSAQAAAQPAERPSYIVPPPDGKPHSFRVANGQFELDGKPVRILSGEMHYPRIPREYWRARLKMARAMGLNAITTYVFWNEHEQTPGVYDFTGNNDVAEFIHEAQQEGLYVILRPGPYVCAEWEFGGYPAWLLKDPTTVVRSSDPKFMVPATRWLKRLGQELAPLQIGNGGPIVLVQVENEYGSFGNDHAYMEQNHQALIDAGFTKAQFYTADGPGDIANGSLPELPVGINFDGNHPNSAEKSFATLKTKRPDGPFFNSEFWAGWFDHWGGPHAHTNTDVQAANLDWMLRQGYSVSIYMFHGGTNFGWMNGANSSDAKKEYEPDVTSYDYDAALDESGRPTAKFYAFRDVIAKETGITPPPVPEVAPAIHIAPFKFTEAVPLWDTLPKAIQSPTPLTMEDIGQNYGYILYRTNLDIRSDTGMLTVHDYAQIYRDGVFEPALPPPPSPSVHNGASFPTPALGYDRRLGGAQFQLASSKVDGKQQLDILVENTSRINYSHQLRGERKGILSFTPPANRSEPVKWYIYPLPMTNPSALHFKKTLCTGPCFYRATFKVDKPGDTFIDTSQLSHGQMWVNGHALGRFWKIGPQKTLYLPGPWLKQGANEVIVFDMDSQPFVTLEGLDKPDLGQ